MFTMKTLCSRESLYIRLKNERLSQKKKKKKDEKIHVNMYMECVY